MRTWRSRWRLKLYFRLERFASFKCIDTVNYYFFPGVGQWSRNLLPSVHVVPIEMTIPDNYWVLYQPIKVGDLQIGRYMSLHLRRTLKLYEKNRQIMMEESLLSFDVMVYCHDVMTIKFRTLATKVHGFEPHIRVFFNVLFTFSIHIFCTMRWGKSMKKRLAFQ